MGLSLLTVQALLLSQLIFLHVHSNGKFPFQIFPSGSTFALLAHSVLINPPFYLKTFKPSLKMYVFEWIVQRYMCLSTSSLFFNFIQYNHESDTMSQESVGLLNCDKYKRWKLQTRQNNVFTTFFPDDIGVSVVFGQPVTLPCSFSRTKAWQLGSTIISWQRGEEVVHKFYHGRDQLDGQCSQYTHRTSLIYSEILNGNASLRLEHPRIEDMGTYSCHVDTQLGSEHCNVKLAGMYVSSSQMCW